MFRAKGFTEINVPDQHGKCFVVTGANTGLGFEISRVLAARGARVLLACRSEAKAEAAMAQIRKATPGADLAFLSLDQADLASVRTAAETARKEPRIDALINNAGVMFPPLSRTKQGFELQFGVNHLGSFALTSLLLPKLGEISGARVVITSSLIHRGGKMDWDDLNAEQSYNKTQRYSDSKLANLLFLLELDRRLRASSSRVLAVGCHPGVATTDLGRHMSIGKLLMPALGAVGVFNTQAMGAWPTLQAATGDVSPGGYYGPLGMGGIRGASGESDRAPQARDLAAAQRLWDVSIAMTGIDSGLSPVS
ncbi:oxidoreductase [Xanthomonas dyei]|uniref:oxidoreductase n=1 Tax=Xanthomonas dyei TaxID=743699 RepID=UPI001E39DAFF|nr:oxidoreductase [Xanthomonas dyei]MCC4635418.1 SDR family NAD(P)-dependent oxidoreductase [Xanthomonas dyei pv. eucalypti]